MGLASRGIACYGVAHLVPAACTLGLAGLVGNVFGDTHELGEFWLLFGLAVGAANTVPKWLQQAILRWGPGLSSAQFRYFLERRRSSWCISTAVAAASVYVIAVATEAGSVADRVGAAMYAFGLSSVIVSVAVLQAQRKASSVARLRVVDGSVTLVAPFIGFALGGANSTSALLALAVCEVVLAVAVFRNMAPEASKSSALSETLSSLPSTRVLAIYGAPMCLWLLANQSIAIADRFIVDALAGTVSAGRYASTYVVVAGIAAGLGAPIMTWFHPEYMSERHDRDRLRRRVSLGLVVGFGVFVIAVPLLKGLLDLALGFDASVEMAAWLAGGVGLYWVALARQKPLEAQASLIGLALLASVCAVVNVALSIGLVRLSGGVGAARATFATYVLYLGLVEVASKYVVGKNRLRRDRMSRGASRDRPTIRQR
jgi:hypothetical protein